MPYRSSNARINATITQTITTSSTNGETQLPKTTRPKRTRTNEDDSEYDEHEDDHARKRKRKKMQPATRNTREKCDVEIPEHTSRRRRCVSKSRYDTCCTELQCIHTFFHPFNTKRMQNTKHDGVYAHLHQQPPATARTRQQAKERDAKLR